MVLPYIWGNLHLPTSRRMTSHCSCLTLSGGWYTCITWWLEFHHLLMLTSFHNFLAAISVARPWKETQFLPTQTADKKMLSLFPLEAKTIFAFMIHVKRMFVACYSSCCYGGWRTKWTCLITNDESLFRAVDRPHCPGHWWVQPYQVHETPFWHRGGGRVPMGLLHGVCSRAQGCTGQKSASARGLGSARPLDGCVLGLQESNQRPAAWDGRNGGGHLGEWHAQTDAAWSRGSAPSLLAAASLHPWVWHQDFGVAGRRGRNPHGAIPLVCVAVAHSGSVPVAPKAAYKHPCLDGLGCC